MVKTALLAVCTVTLLATGYLSLSLAILQPLPERLWGRTNLPPIRGRLRGPAPAAPNDRLSFQGYQQPWRSVPDVALHGRSLRCFRPRRPLACRWSG